VAAKQTPPLTAGVEDVPSTAGQPSPSGAGSGWGDRRGVHDLRHGPSMLARYGEDGLRVVQQAHGA
jgi:hypothetical protein